MLSILKKFFWVKTTDPNWLPAKEPWGENVYKLKFKKESQLHLCLYFFSCFGMTPNCNKAHKRTTKIIEQGEEKLREFVNARSIMGILNDHHQILKDLNVTGKHLDTQIFDYML